MISERSGYPFYAETNAEIFVCSAVKIIVLVESFVAMGVNRKMLRSIRFIHVLHLIHPFTRNYIICQKLDDSDNIKVVYFDKKFMKTQTR